MLCWLLGHKRLPGAALIEVKYGVGYRPFMDGAEVLLCERCHAAYWEPFVDHEARAHLWQQQTQHQAEIAHRLMHTSDGYRVDA